MVPLKLLPKYKEFLAYCKTGDQGNAIEKGTEILSMKVKVRSSNAVIILADVRARMEVLTPSACGT